jgi:hypothetical protein
MKKQRAFLADALMEAHHSLLEDLRHLERAIALPARELTIPIVPQLEKVQYHITEHFRFEEQDGYMEAVRQREPQREREIDQLLEEHRHLAESLKALLAEAQEPGKLSAALAEKTRTWVEQVRRHEAHENRLVQQVFNQDISAED